MIYHCSVSKSCLTLCDPMGCSTTGFSVLHHLQEFAQIHVHWIRDAIYCPQSFPELESFPMSWLFINRWLSFSFSISPSNEYLGLVSFRTDWFDLLVVQGTLDSSLAPLFESINFLVLSLLSGPTLTSVHDYWKNHSFHYMGLYRQSDVSAF